MLDLELFCVTDSGCELTVGLRGVFMCIRLYCVMVSLFCAIDTD